MSEHPDSGALGQPEPVGGSSPNQPDTAVPILLRVRQWIQSGLKPANPKRRRWVRRSVAVLVLAGIGWVISESMAYVGETQVGVKLNNFSGDLKLCERVGYHLFIPFTSKIYLLDKTIQRLDLGWRQGTPGSAGRDLKLKTSDGSNVSLDVILNFKLIPKKAAEVLRHSGPGMRFADLWIEPFARQICFAVFGQLGTEDMYDATKRNEKAQEALVELNKLLEPQGIEVITVIPGEFRFYKEYEEVIQEKKLADQRVQEQQAQARASMQDQERQLVEAKKKAESQLAAFQGESANRLIQAKAEAEKIKREADGKYTATLLLADAAFYTATKQAEGEKATLFAEAEGMEHMRLAMIGDGGIAMIGMEYAKHLGAIKFSATPISREPSVHQIAVDGGASSSNAPVTAIGASGITPEARPSVAPAAPGRVTPPNGGQGSPEGGAR